MTKSRIIIETMAVVLLVACPLPLLAAPTRVERPASEGSSASTTPPTTLRWHQPCAGSTRVESTDTSPPEDITPPPFEEVKEYKDIRKRAQESEEDCHALILRYLQQRLVRNMDYLEELKEFKLVGIPEIPESPRLGAVFNVTDILLETYDWLVRFAVFMEQMRHDESLERDNHGENYSFVRDVVQLEENAIYYLLCKIKSTLHGHNLAPETAITRALMSKDYRKMDNRALQHNKNLIILRDLKKALRLLSAELTLEIDQ